MVFVAVACLTLWVETAEADRLPTPGTGASGASNGLGRAQGTVKAMAGNPIAGATVRVIGSRDLNSTNADYALDGPGVWTETVTDTNGHFVLPGLRDDTAYRLWVQAENYLSTAYRVLKLKDGPVEIWLNAKPAVEHAGNVTMRGRVLKDGKPVSGVSVGAFEQPLSYPTQPFSPRPFRGGNLYFRTKTDTNGVFMLEHMAPNTGYLVYGLMSSLKVYGALPHRLAETTEDGQVMDLRDMDVVRGLRLVGQVKSRHGETLPKDLRLMVSEGPDSQTVAVDAAGRFEVTGLVAGVVSVFIQNDSGDIECLLTGANRSMTGSMQRAVVGQLSQDKEDLLLEVEAHARERGLPSLSPYKREEVEDNGQLPPLDQAFNRPLFGAEASGPLDTVLGGRVVDDKTGRAILNFKVVPGYQPPIMPRVSANGSLVQRMV